ncbi:hypothetical protein Ddc_22095 [Ditylenchus destructor]|nr:hypothetical protein Ddc_22095 [Ditylenchus destructor]
MIRINELRLPLDHPEEALRAAILTRLGLDEAGLQSFTVFKRSYDARKKTAMVLIYSVDCDIGDAAAEATLLARLAGDTHVKPSPDTSYRFVGHAPADFHAGERPRPVVIGFGPCGLFVALILAQMGLRPIVLERGKQVRDRTKDTWGLWRESVLGPRVEVQFGEGGAGDVLGRQALQPDFRSALPDAQGADRPHIGTFRLVGMVIKIRAEIERLGGEIRFQQKVTDLLIEPDADGHQHVRGVQLESGEQLRTDHVVVALGHSARDTFRMLHARGVFIEPKPFSIGFRIEHPQSLIDRARFGPSAGHPVLGAADYKLVHHAANGRSVYSFCMCPGGTVVAAASEPGGVVTNGMSQYSRNERNANAGIVVGIQPKDYRQDGKTDGSLVNPLDGFRVPALLGVARLRAGRGQLPGAGRAGRRLHQASAQHGAGLGGTQLQAGRDHDRPAAEGLRQPAGLCAGRDPRGAARVRAPDPRVLDDGRGADGRGDAHVLAAAHHARQGLSEPERPRPVSGGRGRRLCRRDHVRGRRRDRGGGGGGEAMLGL